MLACKLLYPSLLLLLLFLFSRRYAACGATESARETAAFRFLFASFCRFLFINRSRFVLGSVLSLHFYMRSSSLSIVWLSVLVQCGRWSGKKRFISRVVRRLRTCEDGAKENKKIFRSVALLTDLCGFDSVQRTRQLRRFTYSPSCNRQSLFHRWATCLECTAV